MNLNSLSVVLPVYNEERNIDHVLKSIFSVMPAVTGDLEVIVSDDGSKDKTQDILKNWVIQDARVKVVRHDRNLGYGAALRSGFEAAQKEWVFLMDADRQFDPAEIGKCLVFCQDSDLVAGFRMMRKDPWYRVFLGAVFNFFIRIFFGIRLKDINCGFKLFRKNILEGAPLLSRGALISAELLLRAQKNRARIVEVGVTHYPRPFGMQTGGSLEVALKAVKEFCTLLITVHKI